MAERGNVVLIFEEGRVYLFSHWRGTKLKKLVRRAFNQKDAKWPKEGRRWHDAGGAYLARTIFCALCRGDEDGTGAYALSLKRVGLPDHAEIHVDFVERAVREVEVVDVLEDDAWVPLEKVLAEWTFEAFATGLDPVETDAKDPDVGVPP